MFGDCGLTIDELEQRVAECVALVSGATAMMLPAIRALDAAQVAGVDGARGMDEWLAGRFDVEIGTARTLVVLARTDDDRIGELWDSGASVDRTAATLRLIQSGADAATVADSAGCDLAGVRQLTAGHRRITADGESAGFSDRFLHMQPSLDDTTWRLWGQLSGVDGRVVEKAIFTAVDAFPNNPDSTAGQDRADGLVAVASEWLSGEVGGHDVTAEIFIDGDLACVSDGERGVAVMAGPRVGPATLAEILCSGTIRVTVTDDATHIVSTTPTSRTIPPAIRAHVLHRDGHQCVIGGCQSRTRLQPHHLLAYADGGTHHPDNLVTLCWYHHHVAVHQQGMRIDPDSPPHRRTLLRAVRAGP
jgi:5-methylcytosine-specific restriction endonuclease McrA